MGEFLSTLNPMIVLWLLLFIAFVAGEIATVGLTSIWFAAGALAALIAACCRLNPVIQVILFVVVSVVLLVLTKTKVQNFINSHTQRTNADRLVGQIIQITERVSNRNQSGKAVVQGMEWTVRTRLDSEVIEEGESARVLEISGVKLIVEKV
ncbi:MAG: NfeD family protein [Muribaculaceae bacterium]|nr:NfeD family protein [Roseburia sp.]MCM1430001.1 NfeD family protein [Muribaculaceae bacterium]MCM1492972.1 NfeD family protein [Muribaculaceae bacterium]